MEYLGNNANLFRLMLERTGVSKPFRTAVKGDCHFVTELADDLRRFAEEQNKPLADARLVAESMVTWCSIRARKRWMLHPKSGRS